MMTTLAVTSLVLERKFVNFDNFVKSPCCGLNVPQCRHFARLGSEPETSHEKNSIVFYDSVLLAGARRPSLRSC